MTDAVPVRSVTMALQTFHPFIGGAENQALQLSQPLAARGMRVTVLTRRLPGLATAEGVLGVRVTRLPAWGPGRVATAVFALSVLAWLLARGRASGVIHAHLAASHAVAASLAGRLTGRPVIVKIGGAGGLGEVGATPASFAGRLKLAALRTFLDAWRDLVRSRPDTRLLLAGEGEAEPRFRAEIAGRGLEASVRLLGRRDDVHAILRAANALVVLSLGEAMPNAPLEAMASGLPMLAPRVSGIVGLVADGTHGALFDPSSAAEARRALAWLADDPVRAEAAGRRCRQAAEERSLERVDSLHAGLYARCVAARRTGRLGEPSA